MIIAYLPQKKLTAEEITETNQDLLKDAIWIDLLIPSKEEENLVEKVLSVDIPTREEMQEIELSSRLYKEDDALFMTITMLARSNSTDPKKDAVTLILTDNKLVTVRYIEPHAFGLFISHVKKLPPSQREPIYLVIELLEAAVDRLADILEHVGHTLDDYSQTIFRSEKNQIKKLDYKELLQAIGANGDLNTKSRECFVSFDRLITFFAHANAEKINASTHSRLGTLSKDIKALSDHAGFLSNKVGFLLDATLGMVNIEQNNIIKIFSIAAVIFLPPTLIASIYGMNFDTMPELKWYYGYPISIVLMLISAWLPYKYFKIKKWL